MIKLNDHYFISWLSVVKNINYIVRDNKVYVEMTPSEYTEFLEEYKTTIQPLLKNVRNTVKILNDLTTKTDKK